MRNFPSFSWLRNIYFLNNNWGSLQSYLILLFLSHFFSVNVNTGLFKALSKAWLQVLYLHICFQNWVIKLILKCLPTGSHIFTLLFLLTSFLEELQLVNILLNWWEIIILRMRLLVLQKLGMFLWLFKQRRSYFKWRNWWFILEMCSWLVRGIK